MEKFSLKMVTILSSQTPWMIKEQNLVKGNSLHQNYQQHRRLLYVTILHRPFLMTTHVNYGDIWTMIVDILEIMRWSFYRHGYDYWQTITILHLHYWTKTGARAPNISTRPRKSQYGVTNNYLRARQSGETTTIRLTLLFLPHQVSSMHVSYETDYYMIWNSSTSHYSCLTRLKVLVMIVVTIVANVR